MADRRHRWRRWAGALGGLVVASLLAALIAPRALAQSDEGTTIHIVAQGETLRTIALRYGVTPEAIIAANNILNPDRIYVGQRLVIPVGGEAAGTEAAQPAVHIVQPGENLFRIGLRYNLTVTQLMAANGLTNPNQVYAGQRLVIPQGGTDNSAAVVESSPPPSSNATASTTHIVQRGETLFRIALRYNVSLNALVAANGLASADAIYAGQRLIIPGTGGASAPAPVSAPPSPSGGAEGKQIVVDLSEQRVYAYENGVLVRQFVVSTGLPGTPTIQGSFTIQRKTPSRHMSGPGYDLPGVPWVMYFYRGYALHGTYWHNNFGQPMSHGCVNMRTPDAEWLYQWAPIGTSVRVIN